MRQIVSTPDTLGGSWRIDGSRIYVRSIRNWHDGGYDLAQINQVYPHLNLTEDELAACLAWEFPAIHDAPRLTHDDAIMVDCVCGEEASSDDEGKTWRCGCCGRRYTLTITIEAA